MDRKTLHEHLKVFDVEEHDVETLVKPKRPRLPNMCGLHGSQDQWRSDAWMVAMRARKIIRKHEFDADGLTTMNEKYNSVNTVKRSSIDLVTKMALPDKAVEATGNQRYVALDAVVRIGKTLADG